MQDRIVQFIQALRAAGVRVSLAESEDGLRAIEQMGVQDRELFKAALRTTLVKEHNDFSTFERLFPVFFNIGAPPMQQISENLTPEQQEQMQQALDQLMQQLGDRLRDLLQRLTNGEGLTQEELDAMSQQAGMQNMRSMSPQVQRYIMQQMEKQLGLKQLQELMARLEQALREAGMDKEGRRQVQAMARENAASLERQLEQYIGQNLARQMTDQMRHDPINDLLNQPIDQLSPREIEMLRDEVRRIAARLRTRAALRNRRNRRGTLDAKSTIRHSQRYGGVPIELKYKRKRLKPHLTVICDISTSMRPHAAFMLTLMYELQGIIARTRSFAFIDDIHDITEDFTSARPQDAIHAVLGRIPPGHYSTDLGHSLSSFCRDHLNKVDRRTTVIVLGDGRNNYRDPRLDCVNTIKRHAKRILWFTPEQQRLWGTGDSDMHLYAPQMDQVHFVSTLQQLSAAIDNLLS
ncbi:MAG: VWA domain-containing protein [Herpetosiphon sp.]